MQRILDMLHKHDEDETAMCRAMAAEAGWPDNYDENWATKFETFTHGEYKKERIMFYLKVGKGEWAAWMLHAPSPIQGNLGYCPVVEQNKFRYRVRFVTKLDGDKPVIKSVKTHDLKAHQLSQLVDATTAPAHVRTDNEQVEWLKKAVAPEQVNRRVVRQAPPGYWEHIDSGCPICTPLYNAILAHLKQAQSSQEGAEAAEAEAA